MDQDVGEGSTAVDVKPSSNTREVRKKIKFCLFILRIPFTDARGRERYGCGPRETQLAVIANSILFGPNSSPNFA